jgi:hypothetical protein
MNIYLDITIKTLSFAVDIKKRLMTVLGRVARGKLEKFSFEYIRAYEN